VQLPPVVERVLGRSRAPRGLREPPRLSGGLPLMGHTVEFLRSTIDLLFRAERELGEVAEFQVAHRRMVALFGPKAHEAVFRAPDRQLSPNEAYEIMTPVFGRGVVYDAAPNVMDEQLKMLLAALKDRRMRTYGEIILEEVERSVSAWGDSGQLDLVDYCRTLTTFTSTHCLIGKEFRERMSDEFAVVYHDLERGVTPLAYLHAHLPLPAFRRRDQARVRLVQMITRIVDERRRTGHQGEDFLQTLMDGRYANGTALTEDEITGLLLAAIFAGHHTSSVTTAWTLIELLRSPQYLQGVIAQLEEIYGHGGGITYQSLREITLMDCAVKESLRLHPPLFMLVRVVHEDFVYRDHFLPAGTWLVLSPTVSHRIGSVFREPDRFDPLRFAPPREEDKRDFAYIPFGGGRHKCLGNAFALLQIKAILAVLLQRYEFELAGDPIGSDFHGLVVGPKQPCRIRYRRREVRKVAVAGMIAKKTPAPEEQSLPHAAGCPVAGAVTRRPEPTASAPGCPAAAAQAAPPIETGPAARKRLRIHLDRDLCQGHAVCTSEAPDIFTIARDGKVSLLLDPIGELDERIHLAAEHCPTRTIRLVDAE
jgi:sterol 14alpha-demethylase